MDNLNKDMELKIKAILELVSTIDQLSYDKDGHLASRVIEQHVSLLKTHLDFFQEAPHFLDYKLRDLITILIDLVIKYKDSGHDKRNLSFACLYLLTKVRGYKKVVHFLPHEVQHLYIVMSIIEREDPDDCSNWESKYMLLLWLSVLVLIPLDMKRFDAAGDSSETSLTNRLFKVIQRYLLTKGKQRDAAPVLASKFFTRPEILPRFMGTFIDWCLERLSHINIQDKCFEEVGILSALYYIFKFGRRVDVSPFGPKILSCLTHLNLISCKDDMVVKWTMKLSQRIALSFLKEHDVSWRYHRNRKVIALDAQSEEESMITDEPDMDVPSEVEEVIDLLLNGLRKEDTRIRWSSAKGLGRISCKLSKEMAEAILDSILDLCSPGEGEYIWHGSCLALAELGRRGLILPSSLPRVFSRVKEAAVYDEFKGCFSVGSHVRDAACYVCWSFARAYSPRDLKPFIEDLGATLLTVSVFDREVNCRRAAAAAFQENVGRQGDVPFGIDIIATIDYHSVGNRRTAFVQLAPFVAQFKPYQQLLTNHLLTRKIGHWDKEIRILSAESLYYICLEIPLEDVLNKVIPQLISMSLTSDLNGRHGSILGLGSILRALKHRECGIPAELEHHIQGLVTNHRSRKFMTGIGSELNIEALCYLIRDAAQTQFAIHDNRDLVKEWTDVILDACFGGRLNRYTIQSGIDATPYFVKEYLTDTQSVLSSRGVEEWFDPVAQHFSSQEETNRTTAFNVFSKLPPGLLGQDIELTLLNILITNISSQKKTDLMMATARAAAISCLSSFIVKLSDELIVKISASFIRDNIFGKCLLPASRDYTIGSKGDIAFKVRWNALTALRDVTLDLLNRQDQRCKEIIFSDHKLVTEILSSIIVHCVTNQEQMRPQACNIFWHLIRSLTWIPHQDYLKTLTHDDHDGEFVTKLPEDKSAVKQLEGKEEKEEEYERTDMKNLETFLRLLPLDSFSRSLWSGLVLSLGGLTLSIQKETRAVAGGYFRSLMKESPDSFLKIVNHLLSLFVDEVNNQRMSMSLLSTMEFMITSGFFDAVVEHDPNFMKTVMRSTWSCISKTSDPTKKILGAGLFCSILRYQPCCRSSLSYLVVLLCSPSVPRVRVAVAEKLHTSLLTFSDNCIPTTNPDAVDPLETCLELLSETDWSTPVSDLKPIRSRISSILGVECPT